MINANEAAKITGYARVTKDDRMEKDLMPLWITYLPEVEQEIIKYSSLGINCISFNITPFYEKVHQSPQIHWYYTYKNIVDFVQKMMRSYGYGAYDMAKYYNVCIEWRCDYPKISLDNPD